MQDYCKEYTRVMGVRSNRNFKQIIGEHAVHLIELGKHNKKERKLISFGMDIKGIMDEWINRVAYNEPPDSEFRKTTSKLVESYTKCLVDYVLDKRGTEEWKNNMKTLLEYETKFFNALTKGRDTKNYWLNYTGSLINMVDSLVKDGTESECYYIHSANMIRAGVALGQWLDFTI